jgi:putative transcriptional regulator
LLVATGNFSYNVGINKEEDRYNVKQNIKTTRKSKGLSQQELSIKLNVVRQTISKWEQGLSVPDSDMLISISEVLDPPVSTLLGETVAETKVSDLKEISENLEIVNLQLAKRKSEKQKNIQHFLIILCAVIAITSMVVIILNSPYSSWNYNDPEIAVLGVVFHVFEWLFVRLSPIVLIGAITGVFLIRKKV